MKEGASAAEIYFVPKQVSEAVGNPPDVMLGILISAELSFFPTLKTKMSA